MKTAFSVQICELNKYLKNGEINAEWVAFPTTRERLDGVLERLGIEYGNDIILDIRPCNNFLRLFKACVNFNHLNYLASLMVELGDKAWAILELTKPETYTQAIEWLLHEDMFNYYRHILTPYDLGDEYLDDYDFPDDLLEFFDLKAFGESRAEVDCGKFTRYGYIYPNETLSCDTWDKEVPEKYKVIGNL